MGGGARGQILKDVAEADWSRRQQLLVVRVDEARRFECRSEKDLRDDGWLGNPHILAGRKADAFVQHPLSATTGGVTVTDWSGKQKRDEDVDQRAGMAWAPEGAEIGLHRRSDTIQPVAACK